MVKFIKCAWDLKVLERINWNGHKVNLLGSNVKFLPYETQAEPR